MKTLNILHSRKSSTVWERVPQLPQKQTNILINSADAFSTHTYIILLHQNVAVREVLFVAVSNSCMHMCEWPLLWLP